MAKRARTKRILATNGDGEGYLGWLVGQGYELSVIQPDGSLLACGADRAAVLREYAARGSDHIDLLALPTA